MTTDTIEQKLFNVNYKADNNDAFMVGLQNSPIINLNIPDIKNPLIAITAPLFILADIIKNQKEPPEDVGLFRRNLLQQISSLAASFKKNNISMTTLMNTRYLICCFLDEII